MTMFLVEVILPGESREQSRRRTWTEAVVEWRAASVAVEAGSI